MMIEGIRPAPLQGAREWKVQPTVGAKLEKELNALSDAGYEIYGIQDHGMIEQRNALDPNQKTMMPILTIIAFRMRN